MGIYPVMSKGNVDKLLGAWSVVPAARPQYSYGEYNEKSRKTQE